MRHDPVDVRERDLGAHEHLVDRLYHLRRAVWRDRLREPDVLIATVDRLVRRLDARSAAEDLDHRAVLPARTGGVREEPATDRTVRCENDCASAVTEDRALAEAP